MRGIGIYVLEKDYEKGIEIINGIVESRNKCDVWWGKWGS